MSTCSHCRRPVRLCRRNLCTRCYYTPDIRMMYAPAVFVSNGVGQSGSVLAPGPTGAAPGTDAKVAVLEERAALGVGLWHPLDAEIDLG